MIRFGYLYLNGKLTVYDVCLESRHGRPVWVASLSEDPRVNFSAVRAETAIQQLKEHLEYHAKYAPKPTVTWLPPDPSSARAV